MKLLLERLIRDLEFLYLDPKYSIVDSYTSGNSFVNAWIILAGPLVKWKLECDRDDVVLSVSAVADPPGTLWFWTPLVRQLVEGGPEITPTTLNDGNIEWTKANAARIESLFVDEQTSVETHDALRDLMTKNATARGWGPMAPTTTGHGSANERTSSVDQTEALNAVLSSILEEQALVTDAAWDSCSVVANITDAATQLNAFRYTGDNPPQPTPITDQTLFDKFEALRDLVTSPTGDKWQVCIVKIDRDSRQGVANYVYGDEAALWTVNPETSRRIAENLRPQPTDFV